jgi:pSer/pThr/pTyr-binding forkhead associated (FHA) protein
VPAVVLDLLKYVFLALIFWFLLRAVRVMYLEVAGTKGSRQTVSQVASTKPPDRVTVTAPDAEKDRVFSLEDELIVGRDDKCQIVITDNYASQIHARIFRKDGKVWLEDMGSTNGTYLNRRKVTSPHPVNRGDRGRIGKTELIFRK